MNDSKNIIDLESIRFPVGTKAWHPIFHICDIVESIGNQRTIKAPKLGTVEMIWEYALVHVNELKRLANPYAKA